MPPDALDGASGPCHDMDMHAPDLRSALRRGTRAEHEALESLPFSRGLARGEVGLEAYAGYLEALETIYRAFEGAVEAAAPEALAGAPPFPIDRLRDDRAQLAGRLAEPGPGGPAPLARVRAQLAAHAIRVRGGEDPATLVGVAYVLEGASLGAAVLKKGLGGPLGLTRTRGAGWLHALAERGRERWPELVRKLTATTAPGGDPQVERMVEGARETFRAFHAVVRALDPLELRPADTLAQELNPHAGCHPIPLEDPLLEAALRAGERSWEAWPYYAARYGDRGRAYTRSDSAWLVSQARSGGRAAREQILWLADLLASRGMPRILMEDHLRILREELVAAEARQGADLPGGAPESAPPEGPVGDRWIALADTADLLASRRRERISDRSARGIARRFDARVPAEVAKRHPRMGTLLAAALADEADGVAGAVESLVAWLADPERFPEGWVDEVHRAVRTTRKRLRKG